MTQPTAWASEDTELCEIQGKADKLLYKEWNEKHKAIVEDNVGSKLPWEKSVSEWVVS